MTTTATERLDDYYEILDVEPASDAATIERAIRSTRKRHRSLSGSPDPVRRQHAERVMAQLEAAEGHLLDDDARRRYDAALAAQRAAGAAVETSTPATGDWADRARAYYERGDLRNALMAAKKGTDVDSGDQAAWLVYVWAASDLKRFEEADFASAELVERAPSSATVHGLRGGVLDDMGRARDAETSFRTAARLDPADVYFATRAAWAVLDQGRGAAAIEEAWRIAERFPQEAFPRTMLREAVDKVREREPQLALATAQRLLPLDPAHEEAVLTVALAIQSLEKIGDMDRALAEAWRLLEAFPRDESARTLARNMIARLRDRGRTSQALDESRRLVALLPDDQPSRTTLAWSRLEDAQDRMSETQPGSFMILNKAQAAYFGSALDEVESLRVADDGLQRHVAKQREFLRSKVRIVPLLSVKKVLLAILALVLVIVGLNDVPALLLLVLVGLGLGWLFVTISFKRQYRLDAKSVGKEIRKRGIQR